MKKLLLIIFLSLLFFNSFSIPVSAQEDRGLVPCDLTGPNRCTFCDLFVLADNIIDFLLLRIIPILTAVLIALGGFMYIISRGSPDELARVKKLFTSIGIGLLIIYGAWLIVFSFLFVFGGVAWEGFGEGWWVVYCDSSSSSRTQPSAPPSSRPAQPAQPVEFQSQCGECGIVSRNCNAAECSSLGSDCRFIAGQTFSGQQGVCVLPNACEVCRTEFITCTQQICLNIGPNCRFIQGTEFVPGSCVTR